MAIKWDEDFDVICVGSGLGGLSAALTAAQRGARAIVLEKFELLGGVSALSSGQLWLGPHHLQERDGIEDNDADADAYLNHLSQGFATPERRATFIARGREALQRSEEHTSELQSLMRISYAVFCLKKKKKTQQTTTTKDI